jgi:lipopolysaccharide biosynthesis glycosyltransferase
VLTISPPRLGPTQEGLADVPKAAAWLKPLYIALAPYDRVVWIDADCVVLQPLDPLFDAVARGPYVAADPFPEFVRNRPEFYSHLPLPDGREPGTHLNSGVLGVDRTRDRELLAAWIFALQWASDPLHRAHVTLQDQGLLNWAIWSLRLDDAIQPSQYWNTPPRMQEPLWGPAMAKGASVWSHLRDEYPGVGILHWMGSFKLFDRLAADAAEAFTKPLGSSPP